MSFDPIGFVFPKNNSDSQSKVVDLTKFFVDADRTVSLSDAAIALFMSGGGQGTFVDTSGFWDAVNTDRKVKFIFVVSDMGLSMESDAVSVMKDMNGVVVSIETSFVVSTANWYRVTVVFNAMVGLFVSVTPL